MFRKFINIPIRHHLTNQLQKMESYDLFLKFKEIKVDL